MLFRKFEILKAEVYWLRRAIFNKNSTRPIFVLGVGRSGTHFLAQTLIDHPAIDDMMVGQENPFVFSLATQCALRESPSRLITKLTRRYRTLLNACRHENLVDQSHPNIWHAENLLRSFPHAKFIWIVRNPYSVVHSTLKHPGVLRWVRTWEQYDLPSRFLGIPDMKYAAYYAEMSNTERCSVRWAAHLIRGLELKSKLGCNLLTIRYEDLCQAPAEVCHHIAKFLDLSEPIPTPIVNEASLRKRDMLTEDQIKSIESAVRAHCAMYGGTNFCHSFLDSFLTTRA